MRVKMFVIGTALAIIGLLFLIDHAPKAVDNISEGLNMDMSRMLNFENSQSITVDENDPFAGVFKDNGALAKTGDALEEEGNFLSNAFEKALLTIFILLVIGVVIWIWYLNSSSRSKNYYRRY